MSALNIPNMRYSSRMDDNKARGVLLEALRIARGLTQNALADESGISQASLSKVESGNLEIDAERWGKLAEALGVPISAFEAATGDVAVARTFHRKQRSTPAAEVKKIGADIALTSRRIHDLVGARTTTLQRHDLEDGFVTPQEVARNVRADLGLGTEPIRDLTKVIESAGVWVLKWPLDSVQVDAIASWPEASAPVILIGDHVSPERLRFTMAHELGHAVMHDSDSSGAQEHEADAFAGEFLLPTAELRKSWPKEPNLEALIELKRIWGMSLSALIRRAHDGGLLTEQQYRDWSIRLSTSGMHRREPAPLDSEHPTALASAVRGELDKGHSVDELAARAHMEPREFSSTFLEALV